MFTFTHKRTPFIFMMCCLTTQHVLAGQYFALDLIQGSSADLIHIDGSNGLVVESGFSDGTFAPPLSISLNFNPVNIEFADFNQDGLQDLVALDTGGSLSLSLHDNSDAFLPEVDLPVGLQTLELIVDFAVDDINNDGFSDIAVGIEGLLNSRIAILSGDGTGAFAPFVDLPINALSTTGYTVHLSDINVDDYMDILIKDTLGTVHSLLSDGSGAFLAPGTLPGVLPLGKMYFSDNNNDNIPDMIVLNEVLNEIDLRLGNGDGTFMNGTALPVGVAPTDLVSMDLNLDGNNDMVVVNMIDSSINVITGDGQGGLMELVDDSLIDLLGVLPALNTPIAVVSEDFNGDCRPDIAIRNNLSQESTVLANQSGPEAGDLIFCSGFE